MSADEHAEDPSGEMDRLVQLGIQSTGRCWSGRWPGAAIWRVRTARIRQLVISRDGFSLSRADGQKANKRRISEWGSLHIRPIEARDAAVATRLSAELGYPVEESAVLTRVGQIAGDPNRAVLVACVDDAVVAWIDLSLEYPLAVRAGGLDWRPGGH